MIYPHLLMGDTVNAFLTNDFPDKFFAEKQTELFIYNRIMGSHYHDKILQARKDHGFKICVDLDDYWELDRSHILYDEYAEVNFAGQQLKEITAADFVTTTNVFLADEIFPYNKNVYVVPNAIPKWDQFLHTTRTESNKLRLFWQGSITHEQDIAVLAEPLEMLGRESKQIKMIMGGFHEDYRAWQNMADVYTAKGKHQYKILPGRPVTEYYGMYAEADVCLVPLCNTKFNKMKSNLKILEAANLGLPVIASFVHPYIGLPIMMAQKASDWRNHIQTLVRNPQRIAAHGRELQQFCEENFNFNVINAERQDIYELELTKA
jgi:glycosyltransferase involved in cell wall biosynthesis